MPGGQRSEVTPLRPSFPWDLEKGQVDSSGRSVRREEAQMRICNPKACSYLTELMGLTRPREREPSQSLSYPPKKARCHRSRYQQMDLSWSESSGVIRCLGRSSEASPCWEVLDPSRPRDPQDLSARSLGTGPSLATTLYHPLLQGSSSLSFIL